MITAKPHDYQVRETALDINRSFAVSAPAGSGKTGLLTLRVLKLLAYVNAPDEILCITFTRKAAQEMRERIIESLREVSGLSTTALAALPTDHNTQRLRFAHAALTQDRKKKWQLLDMPSRLKILTIDGYCRQLTNQLPIISQMGTDAGILDNPEIAYRAAVKELINTIHETESTEAFTTLLRHLDNNMSRLADLLTSLLASRDQWLPLIYLNSGNHHNNYAIKSYLESVLQNWAEECVLVLQKILQPYCGELCDLTHYAAKHLAYSQSSSPLTKLANYTQLGSASEKDIQEYWKSLAEILLTKDNRYRKQFDKKIGFPPIANDEVAGANDAKKVAADKKQRMSALIQEFSGKDELQSKLVEIRRFPSQHFDTEQWAVLEALMELLPLLVAHLKLIFSRLESTDFIEITQSALNALGTEDSPQDLSLKLDYQLQHILVDEFQDTSLPQLNLLEALTQNWQPDDGKTLFIVGDAMQSCYGFRNANVGIFLNIRDKGLANVSLTALDLTVNFRSTKKLVNWTNEVFKDAFPKYHDVSRGAVAYSPSHTFSETSEDGASDSYIRCNGYMDENNRDNEAANIAEQVTDLQNQYSKDSIAILVRSKTQLLPIIHALKVNGLSYEAIDIDPLLSRLVIQDLLMITRAVHRQTDIVAWLSLLRAPWCGLDLHDLFYLNTWQETPGSVNGSLTNSCTDKLTLWQKILLHNTNVKLSSNAHLILEKFITIMRVSIDAFRRVPLASLVESIWMSLGGPTTLTHHSEWSDVKTFLALLTTYEQGRQILRWSEFNIALEKLFAQPTHHNNANPVQLMSLHKSKGLEFDSVFIPSLDRATRGEDTSILYWHERINLNEEKQILLSPISSTANPVEEDTLSSFLREEKKIKNRLEETRLLYVGCTRARKRLFLSANLSSIKKDDKVKAPASHSLLGKIWQAVESTFDFHHLATHTQNRTPTNPMPVQNKEVRSYIPRLPLDWSTQSFLNNELPPEFPSSFATLQKTDTDNVETSCSDFFSHSTNRSNDNSGLNVFTEFDGKNIQQKHSGTIFHRILRRLALDGINHWDKGKIKSARANWFAQLRQLGLNSDECHQEIERIEKSIIALSADELSRWVLNPTHTDSQCELRIYYGTQPKSSIIDRTFIHNGTRWIIDYKTSTPPFSAPYSAKDIESFSAQELALYASQLQHYGQLMTQLDSAKYPVKLALFFPHLQHLAVLSGATAPPFSNVLPEHECHDSVE